MCNHVLQACVRIFRTLYGIQDKSKLITYIVAAGLTYGQGEDIFHFLFKKAWCGNISSLQVYGDGHNFVPNIHILDLARYIYSSGQIP